jgi:CCR4-NOT transcription complex subunit 9
VLGNRPKLPKLPCEDWRAESESAHRRKPTQLNMIPTPHVYGHHQYNPQGDSAWLHSQPAHHQHAQQVAAAASAAQQQHYNRIAGAHNTASALSNTHNQDAGGHENVTEENRRTMGYIADLLSENTREAALLELSKKREQVPELALILWHSFGTNTCCIAIREPG